MRFDVIVIGGGSTGIEKAKELQAAGKKCAVISKGRSIYDSDIHGFERIGGTLLMGDQVASYVIEDGCLKSVCTVNLGDVALEADVFYLATGKFFAGGLTADMDSVCEPVFGLDVIYDHDRNNWFNASFAEPQPFMDFGVAVDSNGCAVKDGASIVNLFPIGEIIAKQ